MNSKRSIHELQDASNEEMLYGTVLTLKGGEESRSFLRDLCTPDELRSLAGRWAVVKLVREEQSHEHIRLQTGLSLATIGRVASAVKAGSGGFGIACARIESADNFSFPTGA